MQNQPFADLGKSSDEGLDQIDSPQQRLFVLAAIIVVCTVVIGVRVYYVQAVIAQQFLAPWERTRLVEEILPARNGRILTRDGAVLAFDETRYDIAVDFRWLEEPFDAVWLRRQISARREPQESDSSAEEKLITKERETERIELELQNERQQLFHRLAELVDTPSGELEQRAARLQKRIETMVVAVEARRAEKNSGNDLQALDLNEGLSGIAATIKSELTTPPRRYGNDPLILKEELQSHVLIEDVPLSVVAAIESTPNRFPGVHVQGNSSRVYPLKDVAVHLIGIRKPSASDPNIVSAQGGIEEQYDAQLAGTSGLKVERINRRGEIVESEITQLPQDGADIVLTIDSRLQRTAESLLDAALSSETLDPQPVGGAVIAIDLWTGDILAAAAAPRYSLQLMLNPSEEEWQQLLDHPHQPFFSRATHMALPPGSVFKVVTAAAALEQGEVTPDELFECRGYLHSPNGHRCAIFRKYGLGHGEVQLEDALCQSCNVFFFDLAERLGPTPLLDWSKRFGFGQPTGIDLPFERAGFLPSPGKPGSKQKWHRGSALQVAIGQGAVLATPLQVARMMGAIGNGGYLVTPSLVRDRNQQSDNSKQILKKIPGLSERTLTTIRHGLEMVVHHPRGTGLAAQTPSMTIAAKTGTAEVEGKPDHAWFAGFAPVESPRVAFCVVLEHGGAGGDAAGPIVKQLMTEMIGLGLLQPQWNEGATRLFENRPSIANSEKSFTEVE